MNEAIELLMLRAKIPNPFELTVTGISMMPVLHNGDTISVCRKEHYAPGDILVFVYKQDEVIVHRLLKIEKDRYYCKGDNSFRLEDISAEQIAGAVLLPDDPHRGARFLEASYQINRIFRRCGYSKDLTIQTKEYRLYRQTYLEAAMHYEKNPDMDFIEIDEDNLAVHDTVSGNVFYFSGTSKFILDSIENLIEKDALITQLCDTFEATADEIIDDTLGFLSEMIDLKVVLCH